MATSWTVETAQALVNERMEHVNMQRQLEDVARNRTVFEREVKELRELGYELTWQQCRTKIKNLTQRYRKVGDWY